MSDVLIRDLDPATLARIDAAAQRAGQSRNALLKELLVRWAAEQDVGGLTDEQVAGFDQAVGDLRDEQVRASAWRR